jgi:hypothetical protein
MNGQTIFLSILMICVFVAVILYGDVIRKWFEKNDEKTEYDMIRQYLLNQSPLYGYNKPKLWIHTQYEMNSRQWKSFQSRNSTDLNQPYVHLTVQSIVNMCGNDFHICLIDDASFAKLIPSWEVDMKKVANPIKSHMRQIGLMSLLYYYGGMIVPDSFLCMRSLMPLYQRAVHEKPFVAERLNRFQNIVHENKMTQTFLADPYFMGCRKNDPLLQDYVEFLKDQNRVLHFSSEHDFLGNASWWLENAAQQERINKLDGGVIGIKSRDNKPILLEHLLSEQFIDIEPHVFGIYIPEDEILKRTAYQWFSVMSRDELLNSNMIIAKYLVASLVKTSVKTSALPERMVIL